MGDQLSSFHPIIVFPNTLIHTASNTSIIVVRKTRLTVALCIYIASRLFYIKRLFTNTCFLQFQTKDTDMHVYVDSWHSEDSEKSQQTNKLLSTFLYKIFIG